MEKTREIKNKQPIIPIEYINEDEKVYGSKRINLIRIAQEKKIKALQLAMCRYADKKKTLLRNGDYILPEDWSEDFKRVLRLETHLSSGLNNTLSKEEKKLANSLYRKYLGFVK